MNKVGIIGGAGFIGSHVTKTFLNEGFEVKVSTQDISIKNKYQHLMDLEHSDKLHICELDITNKTLLKDFVKDCDIVIHSGTPFQLNIKDPDTEIFTPTIEGTKNFLEIIKKTPAVKKAVLIASVAAWNTNFPLPVEGKSNNDPFDESEPHFIDNQSHPYSKAKFMANKTVDEFIQNNPGLNVIITSVSPVLVMGQPLSNRDDSTSSNLQFLIKHNIAPDAFTQMLFEQDIEFAIVNVKDVAQAIFKAATIPGLHGKNFLLSSESYSISDIHLMLNNKPPKNPPKVIYQNTLAEQKLGIPFQSVETTLKEYTQSD